MGSTLPACNYNLLFFKNKLPYYFSVFVGILLLHLNFERMPPLRLQFHPGQSGSPGSTKVCPSACRTLWNLVEPFGTPRNPSRGGLIGTRNKQMNKKSKGLLTYYYLLPLEILRLPRMLGDLIKKFPLSHLLT